MKIKIAALLATVVLCGCSSKQNFDYLSSHNGRKLVVPPPLSSRAIKSTYVLPNIGKVMAQSVNPPNMPTPQQTQSAQAPANSKFSIQRSKRRFWRAG